MRSSVQRWPHELDQLVKTLMHRIMEPSNHARTINIMVSGRSLAASLFV